MQAELINFNGELLPSDSLLFPSNNRGFTYGDGLFETIRMVDGYVPLLNLHFERLTKGLIYLGFTLPKAFTVDHIRQEIKKLCTGNQRIRLTVCRKTGGKYFPSNNEFDYIIECEPLNNQHFQLNTKGKQLVLFKEEYLPCTMLSNLKNCNALPYILASNFYHKTGFDDSILLNEHGRVAEASSSNLFIVKNDEVFTPALTEGCIQGVMRTFVINHLKNQKTPIFETTLTVDQVADADEIWLTNSIQGIQWSTSFQNKEFGHKLATTISNAMNEAIDLLIKTHRLEGL